MTVEELIDKLQAVDPNKELQVNYLNIYGWDYRLELDTIDEFGDRVEINFIR